jgi:hypothetical protein
MTKRRFILGLAISMLFGPHVMHAQERHNGILHGAWQAQSYLLKDGTRHTVQGLILFAERDWTVLFFVIGEHPNAGAAVKRGSGEGGTYEVDGNRLVFHHQYHLSAGEAMQSLPASPLRMEARHADEAQREESTFEIADDRLTILFPSGNSMTFSRRPS